MLYAVPGSPMCPVVCLREFRNFRGRRGSIDDPLLIHASGSFLSCFQFVAIFRKGVRDLGSRGDTFLGHSFRIGAAMEAARLGLGDDLIKRIGRWESV